MFNTLARKNQISNTILYIIAYTFHITFLILVTLLILLGERQ